MRTTYTQRDTHREPWEHKMEEFPSSKQNITGSCTQPEGRTQLLSNSSLGWMSHTPPTPTTLGIYGIFCTGVSLRRQLISVLFSNALLKQCQVPWFCDSSQQSPFKSILAFCSWKWALTGPVSCSWHKYIRVEHVQHGHWRRQLDVLAW